MRQTQKLFKVAFRNVSRNVKRTMLTALAVFIGIGVVISVRGLLNGLQGGIKDQVTKGALGDIQVHHADFETTTEMMPLDLNMKLDAKLVKLIKSHPEVREVTGRIVFGGVISDTSREKTTPYFGVAVDVDTVFKVIPLLKDNITKGAMPKKNDALEIVITEQLARTLNLKIGDDVAIQARTEPGSVNAFDFKIVGIFELKLATASKRMIYMPLHTAQKLLDMPQKVTEIVLDIKKLEHSRIVAASLQKTLTAAGYKVKVDPWEEVATLYSSIMGLQNMIFGIVSGVLFILVLTGVINTMLMTVYERVREIGTMMAMGVKRGKVVLMFLFESLSIAAIGSLFGLILGITVVEILHQTGIHFQFPGTQSVIVVRPQVTAVFIILSVVVAMLGALLAATYPAYRASQLRPAEAIRSS
ncbi:MAG: ABC transporter permease [Myxococcales bacterium]|nr:ABC transporter permease [Myxococcales bacterium]